MECCPFCNIDEPVLETAFAFAIFDRYPVTEGHLLLIPRRHVPDYFSLTLEEKRDLDLLILKGKELLDKTYQPDGYNIGINNGKAAGQTIFHLHIHLIPRYMGDLDDPRGGVRGVIPDKRIYE